MYNAISVCRVCSNKNLVKVLDLGVQTLTGVFPKTKDQSITKGPLQLVKCSGGDDVCGLLQLAHSYDLGEMYGDNYGYRSGLNPSMVKHLHAKVARILNIVDLSDNPIVLDIGSNDGTTLSAYPSGQCTRVGIDPTSAKFREYYPHDVTVITDFFSARKFHEFFPDQKARVVTSFSMFYDLESPMDFVREVESILDTQGIWVFEQSYMPLMLEKNSYDTVCHEHLEYYGLKQIEWMLSRCGLKIIDVEFNEVNGGSFSVTAAKLCSDYPASNLVQDILKRESVLGLDTLEPYIEFAKRTEHSRTELQNFVADAYLHGKRVAFLGASTKGNVLLQHCGFGADKVVAVGEVNAEKFGMYTPGTLLPIVDEHELLEDEPDFLIVLPWHFRDFFLEKYHLTRGRLVFPLPVLEVVEGKQ
ncbi:class I SAM-dependent methyltransferase [Neptuniibacter sp. CAU 1671]|uniref:class I SAM-dependent methyltransferase n=1 Tax=Neptuniibacter sp. CAU 1671 TaxID=3032593 RepID=UPI0023DCBF3E|nr:class I SAM-dependent methyltransferase [Neptuniibacter sp. CAU 1671]MDF2181400.1 class I SAM-dependent methyltransferase [Neptuniibacter sp. CAU 1671]